MLKDSGEKQSRPPVWADDIFRQNRTCKCRNALDDGYADFILHFQGAHVRNEHLIHIQVLGFAKGGMITICSIRPDFGAVLLRRGGMSIGLEGRSTTKQDILLSNS